MEKTLKHELYKHGSYLHSLKEAGSEFVNIDDEIKKNEELFQLASKKDHQPAFEVGEYYSSDKGKKVFKIWSNIDDQIEYCVYDVPYGTFKKWYIPEKDLAAIFPDSTPATAEQIATFKRAEHFASKGRKLDEFHVGDRIGYKGDPEIMTVIEIGDPLLLDEYEGPRYYSPRDTALFIDKTAEELQEVENNE